MGCTIVVASGDDGSGGAVTRAGPQRCGYNPEFPASSPYVVGG
jgi:subtilase family serine protease